MCFKLLYQNDATKNITPIHTPKLTQAEFFFIYTCTLSAGSVRRDEWNEKKLDTLCQCV